MTTARQHIEALLEQAMGHSGDCLAWVMDPFGEVVSVDEARCDCPDGAARRAARRWLEETK